MKERSRYSKRVLLLLMMMLFFAPVWISLLIYYGTSWRPSRSTNHGTLIEPARELSVPALPRVGASSDADQSASSAVLQNKWSLLYISANGCDDECRRTLYYIRQTDLGLGNLSARVQQVLLIGAGCCDGALRTFLSQEHPRLITLNAAGSDGAQLLTQFPPAARASAIFIIDPRANLMMRYDSRADPKGLREDLKKLLNLSHIG